MASRRLAYHVIKEPKDRIGFDASAELRAWLDRLARLGKTSRQEVITGLLTELMRDDKAAHAEAASKLVRCARNTTA